MSEMPEVNLLPTRQVALRSAEKYLGYLQTELAKPLEASTRAAMRALVSSIENAARLGAELATHDVPFTKALLGHIPRVDWIRFVNQYALGFGNPAAPVIVMGTEHAYDFMNIARPLDEQYALESLAAENCASALLWLSEADAEMAAHLMNNKAYETRSSAFHRQPWDYSDSIPSGHTWRVVAKALGATVRPVPGSPIRTLGEQSYQIERSAFPARSASDGMRQTSERLAFLCEVLHSVRPTARILIMHGRVIGNVPEEWAISNERLARAFLDVNELPAEVEQAHRVSSKPICVLRTPERTVLLTYALNGRTADNGYCADIKALVQEALSGAAVARSDESRDTTLSSQRLTQSPAAAERLDPG